MDFLHNPAFWRGAIVNMIGLILSIAVHEFGHAFVADRLGDDTPRRQGRVTLNPMVHADPIGTLALPFAFMVLAHTPSPGFGWGRPVQVSPVRFSRRFSMRTGHLLVAAAGPVMNLVFGTLLCVGLAIALHAGWHPVVFQPSGEAYADLQGIVLLNFILAFFNLVPVAPLDGAAVLAGVLPARRQHLVVSLNRWGLAVIALFMFTPLRMIFLWPAAHTASALFYLLGVA